MCVCRMFNKVLTYLLIPKMLIGVARSQSFIWSQLRGGVGRKIAKSENGRGKEERKGTKAEEERRADE